MACSWAARHLLPHPSNTSKEDWCLGVVCAIGSRLFSIASHYPTWGCSSSPTGIYHHGFCDLILMGVHTPVLHPIHSPLERLPRHTRAIRSKLPVAILSPKGLFKALLATRDGSELENTTMKIRLGRFEVPKLWSQMIWFILPCVPVINLNPASYTCVNKYVCIYI